MLNEKFMCTYKRPDLCRINTRLTRTLRLRARTIPLKLLPNRLRAAKTTIRYRRRIAIVAVNPPKHYYPTYSLHLVDLNAALAHALAIAARLIQLSKVLRIEAPKW